MAGYGDDTAFTAWLTANGFSVPGAPTKEVLRQRGSAYIDAVYGAQFSGTPTGGYEQERAWPRTGASAYGSTIPDSVIPTAVEHSAYYAAYQEGVKPGSLSSSASNNGVIKRERVEGAIEVEYFENKGDALAGSTVKFGYIEGLLAPFLSAGSRYGNYGAVLVV